MAVAEKVNPWLPKTQQSLKRSQLAYLPSQYSNEMNKTKLKARFDWNYSEVQQRIGNENNPDNLLFVKNAIGHKHSLAQRSRYRSLSTQAEIESTFTALVNQWREQNRGVSSTNQMSMHPAYQQIIGMGKAVIPLLLRELENKSGRWFWALKSITREDPVPPEDRGKTKEMIKAWLEWGRQKGYKW
jgi:hypothetical protein